ncbi:MAG: substrate-binding domain-containing protein [Gammaproteobacteria bacterium]|nr:substrate-binding domain-containing protein [Gammaproteobacteria bacterium]
MSRGRLFFVVVLAGVIAAVLWRVLAPSSAHTVVVYVSHDQVFSEPILNDFQRDTGILIKAVYDTEETKSAGVMNRLIAEKANPQADVYWANEPIRAEVLRLRGVARSYRSPSAAGIPAQFRNADGYWTGFSARARILIVHRGLRDKPRSIQAYTDPRFNGRAVIANPLFGTTTAHIAALFNAWGDDRVEVFLDAMRRNGVHISSSNGESADQVARGAFDFALVDSDDVYSRERQGQPVEGIYPDQEGGGPGCFIVPNAVLLIKDGPHPAAGKKLIDYLLSRETERKLAFSDAAQIPLHPGVETPADVRRLETLNVMQVDYAAVAARMQAFQPWLRDWVGH